MSNDFESDQGFDDDEGSVTRIIRKMQRGDDDEADVLWNRFYTRLTRLVRNRLSLQNKSLADEEDVALQSLGELFKGLLEGKYPDLANRESTWSLLVTVATRNVVDEVNKEQRLKRGGGNVLRETEVGTLDETAFLDNLPSDVSAPDVQVMITECCADMLESLGDRTLQSIAVMKTAGAGNQEVARALGLSLRSVERRLKEIRTRWSSIDA
ncbi:MAG: ECF-type sigma factor [Planctomycetaceae bacterium]|nr:ECF-type sigma factor [Planctomycetaceae bacterium]